MAIVGFQTTEIDTKLAPFIRGTKKFLHSKLSSKDKQLS
jgi:hypothetical protein